MHREEDHHDSQKMNDAFSVQKIDASLMQAKLYVSADGGWLEIGTGEVQLHRQIYTNESYARDPTHQNFSSNATAPLSCSTYHIPSSTGEVERENQATETIQLTMVSLWTSSSSSDVEPEKDFLLRTNIAESCVYRIHEDTTLLWVDPELSKDVALSFNSREGCYYVMDAIRDFQARAAKLGRSSPRDKESGGVSDRDGYGDQNSDYSDAGRASSSSNYVYTGTDCFSGGVERWEVTVANLPYILESARSDTMHFGPFFRDRADYWRELTTLFRVYHQRALLRWSENDNRVSSSSSSSNGTEKADTLSPTASNTTVSKENIRERNNSEEEETVLDLVAQIGLTLLRTPYTTDSIILAQFVDCMDDCIDVVQYGLGRKNKQLGFISAEERRASFRNPCELDQEMREQIHVLHSCHYLRDLLPISLEEVDSLTGIASPLIDIVQSFQNTLIEKICTSDKWLRNAFRRYSDWSPTELTSVSEQPPFLSPSFSTNSSLGKTETSSRPYCSCSPYSDLANFVLDLSKTIKNSKMDIEQKVMRYRQLFEAGMLPFFTALLYRYVHRSTKEMNANDNRSDSKNIEKSSASRLSDGDDEPKGEKKGEEIGPSHLLEDGKENRKKASPQQSTISCSEVVVALSLDEKELSRAVQSVCETLTHSMMFYFDSLQLLLTEALEATTPDRCTLTLILQCILCAGENAVQHSAFELVSSFFCQPCMATQRESVISFWLSGVVPSSCSFSFFPPTVSSQPLPSSPLQQMVEYLSSAFHESVIQITKQQKAYEQEDELQERNVGYSKENVRSSLISSSLLSQECVPNPVISPQEDRRESDSNSSTNLPHNNANKDDDHHNHQNGSSTFCRHHCLHSHVQLIAPYCLKLIKVIVEFSDSRAFGDLCRLFHETKLFHALAEFLPVDAHICANLQSSAVGVVACLIKYSDKNAAAVAKLCTESKIVYVATSVFLSHCRRHSIYTCSLGNLISLIGTVVKESTVLHQSASTQWPPFISSLPSHGYSTDPEMDIFGVSPAYPLYPVEVEAGGGRKESAFRVESRRPLNDRRSDHGRGYSSSNNMSSSSSRSGGQEGQYEPLDIFANEEDEDGTANQEDPMKLSSDVRHSTVSEEEEEKVVGDENNPFWDILMSLLTSFGTELHMYAHTLYKQLCSVVESTVANHKQGDRSTSCSNMTDVDSSLELSFGTYGHRPMSPAPPGEGNENEEGREDKSSDGMSNADYDLHKPDTMGIQEPDPFSLFDLLRAGERNENDEASNRKIGVKSGSEPLQNEEDEQERRRCKK